MTRLRFLTIEFVDGSTRKYSFPVQAGGKAVRQVKLDQFFKDRFVIVHAEGVLNVFPLENVKSVQLSSDEAELEGIRIPAHAIMGARLVN